ncbi:MAG TPA: NUDIX domain-containing protein [Steroidobacteraceae bacterium]|nr:NUDIX domain-containing protein [Steroidobacteraceae bacterium]
MTSRATRLSAGVVVLRETEQGWRFLLLRAFNHWDFPKGMLEQGEEPLAAAVREVHEETLVDDLDFAWGDGYIETGPYSRGKVARYFIARTATSDISLPVNPDLGRAEHSEFRWVDYDEAMRLVSPRVRPVLRWAAQRVNMPTPAWEASRSRAAQVAAAIEKA